VEGPRGGWGGWGPAVDRAAMRLERWVEVWLWGRGQVEVAMHEPCRCTVPCSMHCFSNMQLKQCAFAVMLTGLW
jgi:hypothetical protein